MPAAELPSKDLPPPHTSRHGTRSRSAGCANQSLKCPRGSQISSPSGGLSCNYVYMIMWPMWKAYLYVFFARLLYNGTLYVFLLLQFLLSVHFCGFAGILAFCSFIAFKDLISNVPSTVITRVFSFSAQARQLSNDFTFVRGLLVLYFLVYICYFALVTLIIIPLKKVLVSAFIAIPAVVTKLPHYNQLVLENYLAILSLPLQGMGLGVCNFLSIEDRYFLPGVVVFFSVLCILFFQLLFLFSRSHLIQHVQDSSDHIVLMLAGVPQIVFGICSAAVIIYVTLIGRVPLFRKYNIFLHFRYIHRIDRRMVTATAVKMAILGLQHSLQPLLIIFIQRRIGRASIPFEHYCMQILCMTMYYLLIQCSDTIVISSSEAYALVKAVYRQAGMSSKLWLLRLLFLGTALTLLSVFLVLFQVYQKEILMLSTPLSFRMYSELLPVYFSNYSTNYTVAIWTCFIHMINSLFDTYLNANIMFEDSLLYAFLMLVYKYTLLVVTVSVTLRYLTSDWALLITVVLVDTLTIPVVVLWSFISYNRTARRYSQITDKEKALCTEVFHDALLCPMPLLR